MYGRSFHDTLCGLLIHRTSNTDRYLSSYDGYWDYHRTLDIEHAEATVTYGTGQRIFYREYIAHLTEDLILARLHAEGEGTLTGMQETGGRGRPGRSARHETTPSELT